MPDEQFEVVIRARDEASPVLEKFNQNLKTTNTNSLNVANGLQYIADKSKWAFTAMSAVVIGATKAFADFENAMAKVATQLPGEAIAYYDEFADAVQNLAIEFGQSTDVMAQGLYDILSAAVEPSEALQLLEQSAKTAAAGFTDVATTADLFTSILNAYGMKVRDAARISDVLFQTVFRGKVEFEELANELGPIMGIAAQAGVSIEDLGAAFATLTRQGIPAAESATAIRGAIMSYIDPSKEAAETAAALGIEFNSTALRTEGLINSIGRLKDLTQEQLSALFPNVRALVAVQGILSDLSGAYEDLNLIMEANNITTEAFNKATDTNRFALDKLKTSIQVLAQDLGEAMAPMVGEVVEEIQRFIDKLNEMDDEQKRKLGELIINLTKVAGTAAGIGWVNKAILGMAEAFGVAASALSPVLLIIEAVLGFIKLLRKYEDEINNFLINLEEKIGLISAETAESFRQHLDIMSRVGEATRTMAEIEKEGLIEITDEIRETVAQIEELEKAMQPYHVKGIPAPQGLMDEWDELMAKLTGLIAAQKEVDKEKELIDVTGVKKGTAAIDDLDSSIKTVGISTKDTTKELEQMRKQLADIVAEAEWTILTANASAYEKQILSLNREYANTVATINAMDIPADEKMEALAKVYEAYVVSIDSINRKLKEELDDISKEAIWQTWITQADEFEAKLLQEEKRYQEQVARVMAYPVELEKEKNAALEALEREHLARVNKIIEDENKRREEEAKKIAEEEAAIEKAKYDQMDKLRDENFRRNATALEILVKDHKAKYDEILSMFEWTEEEKVEINKIANNDILYQLDDFVKQYVNEMREAGRADEEISAGIEDIILQLEKLGINTEVITQLREQWSTLPPVIEETKDQIDDIIDVISDIGDIAIGVSFGEEPTAGQIGGVVGGILGLFSGIPTWLGGVVDMVFGWIDDIQRRTRQAREEAEREIQEMIDNITGNTRQALVAFFKEPELEDAIIAFGNTLNEVIYNMMVDAIVSAIISAEVMQDAAKKLGDAINKAIETGNMEGLTAAYDEYEKTLHDKILPIIRELYSYTIPYFPYPQVIEGKVEVPSFQTGGYVPHTGLALLHAGEYVVPKEENYKSVSFGDVSIVVNTNGEVNGADLWDEFEREARRRGVVLVQ